MKPGAFFEKINKIYKPLVRLINKGERERGGEDSKQQNQK